MVFSTVAFLFYFLPVVLTVYVALPRIRREVLLAASLLFYAWGEPRFLPVLLATIVVTHGCARASARAPELARAFTIAGVGVNLTALVVVKFAGFFADAANGALTALDLPAVVPVLDLPLPLGISFFTFQSISYLIDVRRGTVTPLRQLRTTALYISMFPQLVAGPIVRLTDIDPELRDLRLRPDRFTRGIRRFTIGMGQKVLIANTLAVPADAAWEALTGGGLTTPAAWFALSAYTLQIYYDFAGYSNMAIGLGHLLGFSFPENFQAPYAARSVTEFWRRWHMTLSGWLRDYLYIPLGGSRGPSAATYRNLVVVFVVCGLWHGAAWVFVAWGLFHGALLIVERAGLGALLERLPSPVRRAYLVVAIMFSWVLFRSETLGEAAAVYRTLLGAGGGSLSVAHLLTPVVALAMVAGWVFAFLGGANAGGRVSEHLHRLRPMARVPLRAAATTVLSLTLLASITSVAGGAYNPFIYFRF